MAWRVQVKIVRLNPSDSDISRYTILPHDKTMVLAKWQLFKILEVVTLRGFDNQSTHHNCGIMCYLVLGLAEPRLYG